MKMGTINNIKQYLQVISQRFILRHWQQSKEQQVDAHTRNQLCNEIQRDSNRAGEEKNDRFPSPWEARTRVLLKGYKSVSGNLFPVPDKSRGSFCRHYQSDLSRGPYQSCFQSNCLFIGIVVGVTKLCFSSCCTKIIIIIKPIKSLSVNFNGFNLTSAVLLNVAACLARGVPR